MSHDAVDSQTTVVRTSPLHHMTRVLCLLLTGMTVDTTCHVTLQLYFVLEVCSVNVYVVATSEPQERACASFQQTHTMQLTAGR